MNPPRSSRQVISIPLTAQSYLARPRPRTTLPDSARSERQQSPERRVVFSVAIDSQSHYSRLASSLKWMTRFLACILWPGSRTWGSGEVAAERPAGGLAKRNALQRTWHAGVDVYARRTAGDVKQRSVRLAGLLPEAPALPLRRTTFLLPPWVPRQTARAVLLTRGQTSNMLHNRTRLRCASPTGRRALPIWRGINQQPDCPGSGSCLAPWYRPTSMARKSHLQRH